MKTLHIVGYKNSGKTTLIERWIGIVKECGKSVAVLKHHGHGGSIELPVTETDTSRFFNQGADATLVAGGGACQLLLNEVPDFVNLKRIATLSNPDVLLIEGYKEQPGEKVVLVRHFQDWSTLQHLDRKLLIIGRVHTGGVQVIEERSATEQIDGWFKNWLGMEECHETV